MAAIDKDTRLVMTILFVGAVSGMNVYFYANYGAELPWSPFAHAILFSLMTIGAVMGIKAIMDLAMNDRIELWLLDKKIRVYWEKKQREDQQRSKIADNMRQFNYQVPSLQQPSYDEVSNQFLAELEA